MTKELALTRSARMTTMTGGRRAVIAGWLIGEMSDKSMETLGGSSMRMITLFTLICLVFCGCPTSKCPATEAYQTAPVPTGKAEGEHGTSTQTSDKRQESTPEQKKEETTGLSAHQEEVAPSEQKPKETDCRPTQYRLDGAGRGI